MDLGRVLGYVALGLLAVAAVWVARGAPTHRPFAAWIIWCVVSDCLRLGIIQVKRGAPVPYSGSVLVLAMVDRTLVLLWTFGFLGVVLHYFTPLKAWRICAALVVPFAIALAFALDYPDIRGESFALLLRVVAIFGVVATWIVIVWGTLFRAESQPALAHLAVMFLACGEVIILALPYAGNLFAAWDVARVIMIITLSACLIAHAWALTHRPVPDPS